MIRFFINQYKAVNLIFILVIIAGTITFVTGQKEGFPNVGLDIIIIQTPYPGASAADVETLITDKIENAIDSIDGADSINSFSSEGISIIEFIIDDTAGVPNSTILEDIKTAVEVLDFPDQAIDSNIYELDFATISPNIIVGFLGQADTEVLKTLAKDFERDAKKIPGVGKVAFINYSDLEVWVEVDPAKLKKYNIDISTIVRAIQGRNINMPAGTLKINGEEFFVKTRNEYTKLDDIRKTIIRSNDRGYRIFVQDVATIRWAHDELLSYRRSLGGNGIWVSVFKEITGDTIDVSNGVFELIAKYEEEGKLPPGIKTTTTDDIAYYVKRRLAVLTSNATVGLLFVLLCLIAFLSFRITFWTILGIPFSFCLGIVLAYALGLTLNLMSMFGFIIVVGMVVDDAIIIAENVYSYVERGYTFYDAAILGTKEMLVPVLAIVATTIAAFLPLITLPGIFGDILGIIPKIVVITMLCSLVECLFILPGHLAHLKNKSLANNDPTTGTGQKKPKEHRTWFIPVAAAYEKLVTRVVHRPIRTTIIFLIVMFGTAFATGSQIPFVFFPGAAESVLIDIETPISNGLEEVEVVLDEVEASIRQKTKEADYIRNIVSTVGQDSRLDGVPSYQRHIGHLRVYLDIERNTSRVRDEDITAVLEDAIKAVTGIEKYSVEILKGGPPAGKPIDIYITGTVVSDMLQAADEVLAYVSALPNTTAAVNSFQEGKQEINIRPNEANAAMLDVSLLSIGSAVQSAFSDFSAMEITSFSDYSKNDRVVEVVVKYIDDENAVFKYINETEIRNNRGFNVPLSNVSDIEYGKISGRLVKEDGQIYFSVSALLVDPTNKEYGATALNAMIEEQFPQWSEKYPNVSFQFKGALEEQKELMAATFMALLLSILGIYFVLTLIFRSYIQPLVVMSIIPLGFIGIIFGLFLSGTPLGLMPFLGGVALMGIVVNDSLVMVDKINRLRRNEKMDKIKAIIAGAKSRLRPIIMTSVTTIAGIAPLAYGLLGEEPFLAPMAIALMWGLIVSTFLLLILLPAFYLIVDNTMTRLYRLIRLEYRIDKDLPKNDTITEQTSAAAAPTTSTSPLHDMQRQVTPLLSSQDSPDQ